MKTPKIKLKFLIALFLLNGVINELKAQENLSFTKIIQADSMSKTDLFININDWFASVYNTSNDVIQMADKDAGIIIGNGVLFYKPKRLDLKSYGGHVEYTIKVYIKDSKFKVEITNFRHFGSGYSFGNITTAEMHKTTGLYKNEYNRAWNDVKTKIEAYCAEIFESLENSVKNTNKNENW